MGVILIMGRLIRSQRLNISNFSKIAKYNSQQKIEKACYNKINCITIIKGLVKSIFPASHGQNIIAKIIYCQLNYFRFYFFKIPAVEGLIERQTVFLNGKNTNSIGNIHKIQSLLEGCIINNIEKNDNGEGKIAISASVFGIIISQKFLISKTYIKLPSGKRIEIHFKCYASLGKIAGNRFIEIPKLKAGRAKFTVFMKTRSWFKNSGLTMNPVDHPNGGGNHQHFGHSITVNRASTPGKKIGLMSARKIGY